MTTRRTGRRVSGSCGHRLRCGRRCGRTGRSWGGWCGSWPVRRGSRCSAAWAARNLTRQMPASADSRGARRAQGRRQGQRTANAMDSIALAGAPTIPAVAGTSAPYARSDHWRRPRQIPRRGLRGHHRHCNRGGGAGVGRNHLQELRRGLAEESIAGVSGVRAESSGMSRTGRESVGNALWADMTGVAVGQVTSCAPAAGCRFGLRRAACGPILGR